MFERIACAIAVVLLAIGVLALFVRGHDEYGAAVGFCSVSALAIVQACMIASGIADARRLNRNVRNACFEELKRNFEMSSSLAMCVRDRASDRTDRSKLGSPRTDSPLSC